MKSLKRIVSIIILAAFCFNIMAMLKPNEVYAAESNVISFGNGFIELKANKGNGGFYIKTLEGTKLRKSDKNKNLLFPGNEFDTSFSSFKIDGKDYIFGRPYGFLNMGGEFIQAPALNENTISSTWRIGDVEITQRLEMITNTASQYLGNVIIEYNVTNKSNKAKEIGSRIMLDTMLGENDGAQFEYGAAKNGQYAHVGSRISGEKEYAGGDVPTIWKTYDSFEAPLVAAYGYNGSYIGSNVAAPDKVIMAHWNNLAASMYDYSADPDVTFSDFNNKYETPDSAIAMYWDEKSLGPNESISYKTMYGVMVNITGSEDADFGINLLAPRSLNLTGNMLAYEDNGDFQISVEVDNTIVANKPVSGITLQLTLEEGLSLKDPENTATDIYLENIEAGGTRRFTWDVVGTVQNTACIKGFSVNANKNNAIIATARRYILLPGTYNQKPDITITKVTPNRLFAPGEKYMTVKGTNFSNLVDKQRWAMFLVDSEKKRYEIPMEDVSVNAERNTITAIVRDTSFKVGFYTVEFDFDNEITKLKGFDDSKGKRLTVSAKEIYLSDDPKDDNIRSGAIAFVRDPDSNIHSIETFSDPEDFDKWREDNADMEQQKDETLLLLFIKGKIIQNKQDAKEGKINFSIDTSDEPAIINNTIKYTGEPVSITGDESKNSGNNGTISIALDGELINVGGGSFYKGKCKINIKDGLEYSLDVDREDDGSTEALKLEISPVVSALQSICGFVIEIKYGEFKRRLKDTNGDTLDKPLYAIGYGGMLSLNFLDPGGDDKKSGDSSWDDEDPDKVTLKAEIDNLLYGEYADGNAGFIGLKCEVEIKFPSFLGSLTNDKFAGGLLSIDTVQRKYGVEGELSNLGPIPALEFGLTIVINEDDIPIPDSFKIAMEFKPVGIPLGATPVSLTKIGLALENLYDTIYCDGGTPPLKVIAFFGLKLAETFEGNGSIEVSGKDARVNLDELKTAALGDAAKFYDNYIYICWDPGVLFKLQANCNIIDMILASVLLGIGEEYFEMMLKAVVQIPEIIPIIGGFQLAGVEFGATLEKIYGILTLLGIDFGITYYWGDSDAASTCSAMDSGAKAFAESAPLSKPLLLSESILLAGTAPLYALPSRPVLADSASTGTAASDGTQGTLIFGSNIKIAASSQGASEDQPIRMRMNGMQSGIGLLEAGGSEITYVTNSEYYVNIGNDVESALLEISYSGELPDLSITTPGDEEYSIVMYNKTLSPEENAGANAVNQYNSAEDKGAVYVSIPANKMVHGKWKVKADKHIEISLMDVEPLPKIKSAKIENINGSEITVSWDAYKPEGSKVEIYLIDEEDMAKAENGSIGTLLGGNFDAEGNGGLTEATVTIPDTQPSGVYSVRVAMKDGKESFSTTIASYNGGETFTFTNPHAPDNLENVTVEPAGNGYFKLSPTYKSDTNIPDGYYIRAYNADGAVVDSYNGAYFDKGDELLVGGYMKIASQGQGSGTGGEDSGDDEFKFAEDSYAGLLPGHSYKIGVTPYNYLTDGKSIVMGSETLSELTLLPTATPPSINFDYDKFKYIKGTEVVSFTTDVPVTAGVFIDGELAQGFDAPNTLFTINPGLIGGLVDGEHQLKLVCIDAEGDITSETYVITKKETPPALLINSPVNGEYYENGSLEIKGYFETGALISIVKDGVKHGTTYEGTGDMIITVPMDVNRVYQDIEIIAADAAGNESRYSARVYNAEAAKVTRIRIAGDNVADGMLTAEPGTTAKLRVEAFCENGRYYPVESGGIKWDNLGCSSNDISADGTLIVGGSGVSYLMASLPVLGDAFSYDDVLIIQSGVTPYMRPNVSYAATQGKTITIDLNTLFVDPQGLVLTYTTDAGEVKGSIWTYTPGAAGTVNIAVAASNEENVTGTGSFKLIVKEAEIPYDPGRNGDDGGLSPKKDEVPEDTGKFVFDENDILALIDARISPEQDFITISAYDEHLRSATVLISYEAIDLAREKGIKTIKIRTQAGILEYNLDSVDVGDGSKFLVFELTLEDLNGGFGDKYDSPHANSTSSPLLLASNDNSINGLKLPALSSESLPAAISKALTIFSKAPLIKAFENAAQPKIEIASHLNAGLKLTDEQKKRIIGKQVYSLDIFVQDAHGNRIFIDKFVKPSRMKLPYALSPGEIPGVVTAMDIDGNNLSGIYDSGYVAFEIQGRGSYYTLYNYIKFSDVEEDKWYFEHVASMAAKGYILGMGGGKFAPDNDITRAEYATIIARILKLDTRRKFDGRFSDVKEDMWFYGYVYALSELGIILGTPENTFNPDQNIKREDMVVILMRTLKYINANTNVEGSHTFSDSADISDYAKKAVETAAQLGIISGRDGNIFDPVGRATRAEAAKVLMALLR